VAYNAVVKYVPGLLAGQLSGKAGNTVASRNRNGSYFRTRNIPKLVQNAATTAVRGNFGGIAQSWRALTEAQRSGWTALGANILRYNSLGVAYHLTGLQAYESVNRNLTTYGGAMVNTAPTYTPPVAITSLTLTASSV
jgi:hypothetical protein